MSERYYADPQRIESLAGQLEEIGAMAKAITEEFIDELAPTVRWPGTQGEFAASAGPQEQRERQAAKDTMLAIRDALVAITDATVSQVRLMQGTRDHNIEEIERSGSRIDTDGLGSDPATGGDGVTGGHVRH
ncbi:hypothetical protein [Streptomyces sp. I6]|uniref:hypothetical protein n=1 Tax=Streptomyces sp. I6 TaxID=2483113 RepID=UPI000F4593B5|nr:hypothetical protein [Streptomyces sp. I6]RNL73527.1 hypothetical protein EBF04_26530 [Streptomyces sp. I6]